LDKFGAPQEIRARQGRKEAAIAVLVIPGSSRHAPSAVRIFDMMDSLRLAVACGAAMVRAAILFISAPWGFSSDNQQGIVNLLGYGCAEARDLGRAHRASPDAGNTGDFGPGPEGFGPGGAILVSGEVVAAEMKEVVDLVEPPPNWWTPLLSSDGSEKVSNGPGTASFYG
jgi:hypothetical protein